MSTLFRARWRLLMCALFAVTFVRCSETVTAPTPPPPPPPPVINPPKITCPAPMTLTSAVALTVTYGSATVVDGAPPVTTVCQPASGSLFPIGTTAVSCTATDAQQRTDTCQFNISVVAPPVLTKTSFVAFGDSITAGEDGYVPTGVRLSLAPTVILVGQEYPTVLKQQMLLRYTTQTSAIVVDNKGQPGERVIDTTAFPRLKSVLSSYPYQVLLFMEGSNDCGDQSVSELQNQTIPTVRQMLLYALGRGVRPYLATVPPMVTGAQRAGGALLVPYYNGQIRAMAADLNVTLVDIAQVFGGDGPLSTNPGTISADGLHPNAQGYAAMAAAFLAKIQSTLEQPTNPSPTTFSRTLKQSPRVVRR